MRRGVILFLLQDLVRPLILVSSRNLRVRAHGLRRAHDRLRQETVELSSRKAGTLFQKQEYVQNPDMVDTPLLYTTQIRKQLSITQGLIFLDRDHLVALQLRPSCGQLDEVAAIFPPRIGFAKSGDQNPSFSNGCRFCPFP